VISPAVKLRLTEHLQPVFYYLDLGDEQAARQALRRYVALIQSYPERALVAASAQ